MPDFGFFPESPDTSSSPVHPRLSANSPSNSPRRARGSSINGTSANQNMAGTPPAASHSLAAAAALNAGLHNESRRSVGTGSLSPQDSNGVPSAARRRSSIRMNLNLNDPALPAPGELAMSPAGMNRLHSSHSNGSPGGGPNHHHHRAPSLGDIHQEMESETEAQVNRLLGMIRQQQVQIQSLQHGENSTAVATEDSTPVSERSQPQAHNSGPSASPLQPQARARSPYRPTSASTSMSRQASHQSHVSSSHHSPSISSRPHALGSPSEDHSHFLPPAAVRDESAFYQAETQTLTRENQMLKQRIRELERQLGELGGVPATSGLGEHGSSTHTGGVSATGLA